MGLVVSVVGWTFAVLCLVYVLVPFVLQQCVGLIGHDKERREPVFERLEVVSFDDSGLTVGVRMRLPLPFAVPLPKWFYGGVAPGARVEVSRRRGSGVRVSRSGSSSASNGSSGALSSGSSGSSNGSNGSNTSSSKHTRILQPLLEATLSKGVEIRGTSTFLLVSQDTLTLRLRDFDTLRRLTRKVSQQLSHNDPHLDAIDIHIKATVDIQLCGILIWHNVRLERDLDVAPLLEQAKKDPRFKQSQKAPPPLMVPDLHSLDKENDYLHNKPGPLHLYNVAKNSSSRPPIPPMGPPPPPTAIDSLLPGLKLNTLPQQRTPQNSVRSGIRASFTSPPTLHLQIHKLEFNVKLNGEHVAKGLVSEFKLGHGSTTTDIFVEITPSVVGGGTRGLVRGAIGGAKGLLKGVIQGALSGLKGGDFGDGSTVFEVCDVNLFVKDPLHVSGGRVKNVAWIRDWVKVIDLNVDVNQQVFIPVNIASGALVSASSTSNSGACVGGRCSASNVIGLAANNATGQWVSQPGSCDPNRSESLTVDWSQNFGVQYVTEVRFKFGDYQAGGTNLVVYDTQPMNINNPTAVTYINAQAWNVYVFEVPVTATSLSYTFSQLTSPDSTNTSCQASVSDIQVWTGPTPDTLSGSSGMVDGSARAGVSPATIAGIVIGTFLVLALAAVLWYLVCMRRKNLMTRSHRHRQGFELRGQRIGEEGGVEEGVGGFEVLSQRLGMGKSVRMKNFLEGLQREEGRVGDDAGVAGKGKEVVGEGVVGGGGRSSAV
ncbi:hypothetical protein HDU98_005863 [Podochytrium sp. JEL0797]|nr:hypothetical protein HDU98_005863 [Podochytrium sp. JEL0797]